MPTEPNNLTTPASENTKAILDAIARVDEKVNRLQDVTEAVVMIREMYREKETFKDALKRALTQFLSLAFPGKEKR